LELRKAESFQEEEGLFLNSSSVACFFDPKENSQEKSILRKFTVLDLIKKKFVSAKKSISRDMVKHSESFEEKGFA